MAESCISVGQNQFNCPVCLDLLKDPVTIPCGHSYCKVCINATWDRVQFWGYFKCPECRATFSSRPALHKAIMLADVMEKLKKTELQAASSAHCYAGPGDVECDFCTGRKHKAVKSCLVCLASYCEDHLQPHYHSPAFKRHELVEACTDLQEKICSEHNKLMEIYCRTDQSLICYLCMMEKHKGHDTVKVERTEKQAATDDSGKIFTELISSIRQEIADLKKRVTELKKLSHTDDHLHLLQVCGLGLGVGRERLETGEEKHVDDCFVIAGSLIFGAILKIARKTAITAPHHEERRNNNSVYRFLLIDPGPEDSLLISDRNKMVTCSVPTQQVSNCRERFIHHEQVLRREKLYGRWY